GVAQGIAFGADLPVVPVSNLAAAAAAAFRLRGWRRALVAFDARMGEIYAGTFGIDAAGLPEALGAEALLAPDALAAPAGEGACGVGSAFAAWPMLGRRLGPERAAGGLTPPARALLTPAAAG